MSEESQMNEGMLEEDEEDGDDSVVDESDEMGEPETGVSQARIGWRMSSNIS